MKKVLVFIFDEYADWEPAYLSSELNGMKEYQVKTISLDRSPKISMGGFHVIPDYTIDNFPKDFCLLMLTGGLAWSEQKNNQVLPVVEFAVQNQIPVGAICNATNFMAENGFLDQIRHTGNTLEFMKLQAPHYQGEANYVEKQAVCDSNIITANGSAVLEFTREILLLLKAKTEGEIQNWYHINRSGYYCD